MSSPSVAGRRRARTPPRAGAWRRRYPAWPQASMPRTWTRGTATATAGAASGPCRTPRRRPTRRSTAAAAPRYACPRTAALRHARMSRIAQRTPSFAMGVRGPVLRTLRRRQWWARPCRQACRLWSGSLDPTRAVRLLRYCGTIAQHFWRHCGTLPFGTHRLTRGGTVCRDRTLLAAAARSVRRTRLRSHRRWGLWASKKAVLWSRSSRQRGMMVPRSVARRDLGATRGHSLRTFRHHRCVVMWMSRRLCWMMLEAGDWREICGGPRSEAHLWVPRRHLLRPKRDWSHAMTSIRFDINVCNENNNKLAAELQNCWYSKSSPPSHF